MATVEELQSICQKSIDRGLDFVVLHKARKYTNPRQKSIRFAGRYGPLGKIVDTTEIGVWAAFDPQEILDFIQKALDNLAQDDTWIQD